MNYIYLHCISTNDLITFICIILFLLNSCQIFRQFQVYKTNQVLHFDGRELVGDDCTLGELCVPPEALIKLEVMCLMNLTTSS